LLVLFAITDKIQTAYLQIIQSVKMQMLMWTES